MTDADRRPSPRRYTARPQVAGLLVEGFREHEPDAFLHMKAVLAEVRKSFDPECLSRGAVEPPGTALGWIGRAPVRDLERRVARPT